MSLTAAVGLSLSLDSREAGAEAAQKVLAQLGRVPLSLGIMAVSHDHLIQQAVDGAASVLGEIPLFGFSTSGEVSSAGQQRRSVMIAVLSSSDLQVKAGWWPELENTDVLQKGNAAASLLSKFLSEEQPDLLLLAGEGFTNRTDRALQDLAALYDSGGWSFQIAGCLSGGEISREATVQICGPQTARKGLAAAWMKGSLTMGVGTAHVWSKIGPYLTLTSVSEDGIQMLDGCPAAEVYARLLGGQPKLWSLPPLNEIVRLYPLEVEDSRAVADAAAPIRSPFFVRSDGSLRMNTRLSAGSIGHLMMGSASACAEAAKTAAQQAMQNLEENSARGRPVLALVLIDEAWRLLLEGQPGEEVHAVRSILGEDLPIIGGYVLGQIVQPHPSAGPQLLNQNIEIILFAEK